MSNAESYLDQLRQNELEILLGRHGTLFADKDLLEIGCGGGAQLLMLKSICHSVAGVEIEENRYAKQDIRSHIRVYNGRKLPYEDESFDIVYSSNVLEHVVHRDELGSEIRRVLRANGVAVHVLPSHTWRLWTMLTHYVAIPKMIWLISSRRLRSRESRNSFGLGGAVSPTKSSWRVCRGLVTLAVAPRHGEHGNRFREYFDFKPSAWKKMFSDHGWQVEQVEPLGMFYTGNSVFGRALSFRSRRRLASLLGSSTWIYVLRPSVTLNRPIFKTR